MQIWLGGTGKNEYIVFADNVHELTDGNHTFEELYDHRHILACHVLNQNKGISFKTRKAKDGEEWEGWFIAGMNTPYGQISYHFPTTPYWYLLDIPEIERNDLYDDHNSRDVYLRLINLLIAPQGLEIENVDKPTEEEE